jgi:hypothetical protein
LFLRWPSGAQTHVYLERSRRISVIICAHWCPAAFYQSELFQFVYAGAAAAQYKRQLSLAFICARKVISPSMKVNPISLSRSIHWNARWQQWHGTIFALSMQIIAFLWSARLARRVQEADLRLFIESSPLDASTNERAKHPKTNMEVLLLPISISCIRNGPRWEARLWIPKAAAMFMQMLFSKWIYTFGAYRCTIYIIKHRGYLYILDARFLALFAADDDNQRRHHSDNLLFERKIEPLGEKKEQSNGFTSSHLKY